MLSRLFNSSCRALSHSAKNVAKQTGFNVRTGSPLEERSLGPVLAHLLWGTTFHLFAGYVVYREWRMIQDPALSRDRVLMLIGNIATAIGVKAFLNMHRRTMFAIITVGRPPLYTSVAALVAAGCISYSIPDEYTVSKYAAWLVHMGVAGNALTNAYVGAVVARGVTMMRPSTVLKVPTSLAIGMAIGVSMSPCDHFLVLALTLGNIFYTNTARRFIPQKSARIPIMRAWLWLFTLMVIATQQGKTTKHPQKEQFGDHDGTKIKSLVDTMPTVEEAMMDGQFRDYGNDGYQRLRC